MANTNTESVIESVTESTRAVVANYMRDLGRWDLEALRASFSTSATWTVRGGMPVSRTWTGAGEILDGFVAKILERLDTTAPITQDVHRIIADGEYAVVEWTTHAHSRDGRPYDNDYAVVFHVVDGLIASVVEYFDTAYMKEVLFGG
jgi:ketosteroid isomerase-like protein